MISKFYVNSNLSLNSSPLVCSKDLWNWVFCGKHLPLWLSLVHNISGLGVQKLPLFSLPDYIYFGEKHNICNTLVYSGVQWVKFRHSHVLGKCSTTELHPRTFSVFLINTEATDYVCQESVISLGLESFVLGLTFKLFLSMVGWSLLNFFFLMSLNSLLNL